MVSLDLFRGKVLDQVSGGLWIYLSTILVKIFFCFRGSLNLRYVRLLESVVFCGIH